MSGPRYDDPIDDGRETADLDGRSSVRVQAQLSRTPARSVSRVHDAVDADELAEGTEQLARLADEDLPLGELAYSHAGGFEQLGCTYGRDVPVSVLILGDRPSERRFSSWPTPACASAPSWQR